MANLTPQHKILLALYRDMQYHCSTQHEYMRDARKRISELNNGYLKEKGYQLVGVKCDGRCGKTHASTLFMRRAERIDAPKQANLPHTAILPPKHTSSQDHLKRSAEMCRLFDMGRSSQEVFAI